LVLKRLSLVVAEMTATFGFQAKSGGFLMAAAAFLGLAPYRSSILFRPCWGKQKILNAGEPFGLKQKEAA